LGAGYQLEREHFDQTAPGMSAYQRFQSAYAQDQVKLLSGALQILLAGRFTDTALAALASPPGVWTGDAAAAYLFARTGTKLRAHIGNGVRMPSLYERFGGYWNNGRFMLLGNPSLNPERVVSGDAGLDQYLWSERVTITANYFYSELQNVIVFPSSVSGVFYDAPGGLARGVEVSAEVRPVQHTSVSASYVYSNAKENASLMPLILPNEVKLVAMRDFGRGFDGALDFNGGSGTRSPGPEQLGISAAYRIRATERLNARLYVRIWNALNQEYFENGYRTPRRWAVAGVHLTF
jgi:outer membrane receptor protein involved in Fe transport